MSLFCKELERIGYNYWSLSFDRPFGFCSGEGKVKIKATRAASTQHTAGSHSGAGVLPPCARRPAVLMESPRLDFSHGVRFSAKVRAALGSSVVSFSLDDASSFWLIASFSRSKLRLNCDCVSWILEATLGGTSSLFSVVEVDHWVFKFFVASSQVGFMIYALKGLFMP